MADEIQTPKPEQIENVLRTSEFFRATNTRRKFMQRIMAGSSGVAIGGAMGLAVLSRNMKSAHAADDPVIDFGNAAVGAERIGIAFYRRSLDGLCQRWGRRQRAPVARVDQDGDGVVSFAEADIDGTSDGLPNTRLYLPAPAFDRFAVTREINDGLLAPRFAPGQRGYVLSGLLTRVEPAVVASEGRDSDDR